MITYETISKFPQVANSLLGMSMAEFEELYAQFEPAYSARGRALQVTRRRKAKRRRVSGAGRKHKYSLRDRLLMTLFWLRAYPTYEVLGLLYDLDKTSVGHNLTDVLDTLTGIPAFDLELPKVRTPKLRSVREVMDTLPDVGLVISAQELRTNRGARRRR